ncbi:MAG: DUF1415 domain-containing protein [Chitinophagaceae bacterium]|nr:DUF1415 domain-containing protein [Chitinophagaceae bacterium]
MKEATVIAQTKKWISDVVIGCNFCPFARQVVVEDSIRYTVIEGSALHTHASLLLSELDLLTAQPDISTSLLIFPDAYGHFRAYLDFLKQSEKQLVRKGFEGIFQLASFHPQYCFGGSKQDDPANYTNRSPYPMLHILREDSLSEAISRHKDATAIPQRNIAFARQKGLAYMKQLFLNTQAIK